MSLDSSPATVTLPQAVCRWCFSYVNGVPLILIHILTPAIQDTDLNAQRIRRACKVIDIVEAKAIKVPCSRTRTGFSALGMDACGFSSRSWPIIYNQCTADLLFAFSGDLGQFVCKRERETGHRPIIPFYCQANSALLRDILRNYLNIRDSDQYPTFSSTVKRVANYGSRVHFNWLFVLGQHICNFSSPSQWAN